MTAIYLIDTPSGKRLIKANSRATAINHVVQTSHTGRAIGAVELIERLGEGLKVEDIQPIKTKPEPITDDIFDN